MIERARGAARFVLPVALLLGLAACAPGSPGGDEPTAAVVATADCLSTRVLTDLGLISAPSATGRSTRAEAPQEGRVPDDFLPVGVVVCAPGGTLHDSSGTWIALTARRLEGDLRPLVSALRRPTATPGGTCAGVVAAPPALWLVDALGRAIRPVWPKDRCGSPHEAVSDALDALEEIDREKYPVRLLDEPADPSADRGR